MAFSLNRRGFFGALVGALAAGPAVARTIVSAPPAASMAGMAAWDLAAPGTDRTALSEVYHDPFTGQFTTRDTVIPNVWADHFRAAFERFAEGGVIRRENGQRLTLVEK